MMHTMAQWNWGGLAFVGGMFALVALSGWATERLRHWAERPEKAHKSPRYTVSFNKEFSDLVIKRLMLERPLIADRIMPPLPPRRQFIPSPSKVVTFSRFIPPSDTELLVMRSATERKQ